MGQYVDVDDLRLNYNPEQPQARFKAAGVAAALVEQASERLPSAVPWPESTKPTPSPLAKAPAETADLSQFKGYDAIIVTWTSAEAAALAAMMTPGFLTSDWYEYRHGVETYIPLVTGPKAPFNDTQPDMARYYHSLGLYFPCRIGKAKVLLFKSGLHLAYDGPATPVKKLMMELVQVVEPKVFITTGTGGGIGKDVALGDVVVAGVTQFDCTTQFKNVPWASTSYKTTPLPPAVVAAITPALTKVNASRIPNGRPIPKIWSSASDTIVTTDFFGFDDSTNFYKLQAPGHRACDMGDAMVGQVMQQHPATKWFAIRNASDPQMPNPNSDIQAAHQQAAKIYAEYGAFTTAASVIASWAVISSAFSK